MIKKILSIALSIALVIGIMPSALAATETTPVAEHTEMAYGTPVIDGEIDKVWDNTNYNVIDIVRETTDDFYRGWFKLLWDEQNMYVLAKIYGEEFTDRNEAPYENDSIEIFVDEQFNKDTKYGDDDYQIRSDFNGMVTTSNYDSEDIKASGKLFDNYYVVEIVIPFKTITPAEGKTVGFDVQVNTAATTFFPRTLYGWSESSRNGAQYINTSIFGSATLQKSVSVKSFSEPAYEPRVSNVRYQAAAVNVGLKTVENVSVDFDGTVTGGVTLIHADDQPMIEIGTLANIIGGTVVNGNTLIKDKVTLQFTAGDRIAHYTHADYPNQAEYLTTYYKNTSNVTTGKGSNTTAKIEETAIPGETLTKLPSNYVNDGTDGVNDGYILERAPVNHKGNLYIPLYCIVPTLNYHVEYYRFNEPALIEISTGTNYPSEDTFDVYYAKDFGAVGDGVTDDREAILKGFHAATMSGKPAKFVLEEGKTYRVSERVDMTPFFYVYGVENFVFEGNGSTILFERPLNSSIYLRNCKNVKFKDVSFIYEEATTSHGIIREVNQNEGWFTMEIPPSASMPPPTDWVKAFGGSYGFGQVYDIGEKHLKFIPYDNYTIDGMEHLGERLVKVYCSALKSRSAYIDPGDGFVFKYQWQTYDMSIKGKDDTTAGINIFLSSDITIDGVILCGSNGLGVSVGLCDGKITFRNYQMRTQDGQLTASAADGIHYWRNRSTLLIENCELWNNIDDHVNTKGEFSTVTAISDDRKTVTVDYDQNWRTGDEILFFHRVNTNTVFGNAYIKSVDNKTLSGKQILELDREVPEEVKVGTEYKVYNNMAAGYGTCIRGSRFIQSRRHAYISRSRNVIYMNNYVQNNGGSTVAAEDEIGTSEGPFPQAFTIRNNRTYGDGITEGSHVFAPIQVRAYNADANSEPNIDGVFIQGNILQLSTGRYSFYINCVKNLYMLNNRILWNDAWNEKIQTGKYKNYSPVYIFKSGVAAFDGLEYDNPVEVSQVVHFAACEVDEDSVKNIKIRDGNNSTAVKFEQCN